MKKGCFTELGVCCCLLLLPDNPETVTEHGGAQCVLT